MKLNRVPQQLGLDFMLVQKINLSFQYIYKTSNYYMKKTFLVLTVCMLIACNSSSENEGSTDTPINDNTSVENVNGNIPDTTNTITIDGGTHETAVDSTRNTRDTTQK